MALNFREIVRNDESLLQLMYIVDGRARNENGAIIISDDIGSICAKITMINTKNPKMYSRRIAWTLTGTLLLGLTTYYNLQLQICFDECLRLKEASHHLYCIETTKTTKRKVKQVTKTKDRKRRTVEIEEEMHSVKRYRFWEEPLELDEHLPEDSCLVPANQITLREFNEPPADYIFDDEFRLEANLSRSFAKFKPDYGFGEDMDFRLMEVDEMPSFDSDANDEVFIPPAPQCTTADLDENMNDILTPQIGQNLLSDLSPVMPPPALVKKRSKGRRRSSIIIDKDTGIASNIMHRRISNVFVNCQKRTKIIIKDKQKFALLKLKSADLFSIPVMKGTVNRDLFALTAKNKQIETDWTIIQDAFDSPNCDDANEANTTVSSEVDILRNESENRIQTPRQAQHQNEIRLNAANLGDALPISTSTGQRSPQSIHFSTPYHLTSDLNFIPDITDEHLDLVSPPSNFRSSNVTPPVEFSNTDQDGFKVPNVLIVSKIDNHHVSKDSDNDFEPMANPQNTLLISALDENSLEYATISKLMKLWQKSVHPIRVENLLKRQCNRFQAAKTFASLLTLKKKKLVQLDNTEDGKIAHISQGEELQLNCSRQLTE